jgi:V-type H+-transporting ATPase subunit a
MMGFLSFFCGLIYNDFFSLPLPLFKTCYEYTNPNKPIQKCVYPVGLDYSWHLSINKVSFMNSFKMKLSIVLGVTHMIVGIFNKCLNSLYFKDIPGFFFEFVP